MKKNTNFTTNTSKQIGTIKRRRDNNNFEATILSYGTWGGGSMAYYVSPNAGTTKIPLKDLTGLAYTATGDDEVEINFGATSHNDDVLTLWATLSGSSGANINIDVCDNV